MSEGISHAGKTYSIELIFMPLFILLIVGIIANNYNANGIQTNPSMPNPCQGVAICYATNSNGCDLATSNCNFTSTTTFQFLNNNSPFTYLIQGNILGFFGCLTGCPSVTPANNLIFISGCSSAFITGSGNFITFMYCAGGSFNSPLNVPAAPYNATSSVGNNSQWFIQGLTAPVESIYGLYIKNGTTFHNTYCDAVKICYNTAAFTCPYTNATPFNTTNTQYCLVYVILNVNNTTFGNTFSIISFLFSIILLLLAFGLTISATVFGTGGAFGVNEQGTRMAGVFGFSLLIWSFIYSEFGSWLNNLPFNLSTIGFITLTGMFFMGIYWRLFSIAD